MAQMRSTLTQDRLARAPKHEASPDHAPPPEVGHTGHGSHFWRHFLEMLGVMAVGMIATIAIFLSIVGLKTWDEVTVEYPTQALLAMAVGMTVPMVAWMLYRGHGRENSYEMAGAMVLPVIPFLCPCGSTSPAVPSAVRTAP